MVLYVYRCKEGHDTDEYRSIKDRNEPLKCRVCGKRADKVYTPVQFSFHGLFNEGPPGSN